jgi:ubiquinone/menaquinone biosynthesis C-methylase UbiE
VRYRLPVLTFGVAGLAAALVLGWVSADEPSVRPGINAQYEHPDFQRWQAAFEHSGREVYDRRRDIVAAAGVRPGMAVADIGAGTGLFTLLFAAAVGPTGRVQAVDISKVFVDNILRRSRQAGFGNVEGIVGSPRDVSLPPASVDLAFVCDTYHHFEYPRSMLQSIRRALRPGGTLVIVDYRRAPGQASPWILEHVRAGKETVSAEVSAAGFRLVGEPLLLRENYFLKFRKD